MRRSVVLAGVLAALVGAYVFFVAPLSEKRTELKERLQTEYMTLKKYEKFIQRTEGAEAELKAAAKKLKKMERNTIHADDTSLAFSRLQIKIQDIAEASGFTITSIKPLSPVNHNGYAGLPIYLNGTADIAHLSSFLKSLDSNKVFISIDRLDVATAPEKTLRIKMQLSGLMKT